MLNEGMNDLCTAAAGERLPLRMDPALCLAAQRAVPVPCPWFRVQQEGSVRVQHGANKGKPGHNWECWCSALPCIPGNQETSTRLCWKLDLIKESSLAEDM